jgi:hypothetical protein
MVKVKYSPKYIKICDIQIRETEKLIDNPDYIYDWDLLKDDLIKDGLQECIHVEEAAGTYHLINGHHRIQILSRLYGEDVEVPIRIQANSEKYRPQDNG